MYLGDVRLGGLGQYGDTAAQVQHTLYVQSSGSLWYTLEIGEA